MKEHPTWRLLLTVHDEILMSVPEKDLDLAMRVMRDCMASPKFDVPMLSEGTYSRDNWAAMKTFDKRGVKVAA
jgi:DNA polymerase I-like protein with 3'-5' exonuclease and polymerase domains